VDTLRRLFSIASLIFLLVPSFTHAQDKPGDNSNCCPQQDSSQIVMVNGVAEPVHRVGGKVSHPRPTYTPSARYSEQARKEKIEGTVMLLCVVTSAGEVTDIRVTKGLGYGLDEKAIQAVKQWKFKPAMRDGKPVSVEIAIEQDFHLY
jgi:TonB family protein